MKRAVLAEAKKQAIAVDVVTAAAAAAGPKRSRADESSRVEGIKGKK
jgi:hypothetical protein